MQSYHKNIFLQQGSRTNPLFGILFKCSSFLCLITFTDSGFTTFPRQLSPILQNLDIQKHCLFVVEIYLPETSTYSFHLCSKKKKKSHRTSHSFTYDMPCCPKVGLKFHHPFPAAHKSAFSSTV